MCHQKLHGIIELLLKEIERIPNCKRWDAKTREGINRKAPSSLLLKACGDVVAFGYEADDIYCDPRRLDGNIKDYCLIQRIKKLIVEKKPEYPTENDWEIPSVEGNMFSAKSVLSKAIDHFVKKALADLSLKHKEIKTSEVSWIFTIPAIWDDILKHLMSEAAKEAGIPSENITLALEPEAAAIQCLIENKETKTLSDGAKFVLLDIGGCTIDVSVQRVRQVSKEKFRMELLLAPLGDKQGGTKIDDNFKELLNDTFGDHVMQIFTSEHRHQFMELMREFEAQKRGDPGHIHLRLPSKLMKIYSKENDKNEVNIQIDAERKFHIDEELDRINISEKLFKDLFQETLEAVKACLNRVFENDDCKDIETIIAVGGLSESLFVRNLLEDHFPTKKLYVPSESDLAVLKGAVEFGMDPDIITSRLIGCDLFFFAKGTGVTSTTMKYVTESITLPTPPDHLLEYDYVRTKANKCLDELANSTFDENVREQIENWKTLIQNQILLVHESQFEEKMDGHLQQLFKGKVELRKQTYHTQMKTTSLSSQVRIVILETEQNEEESCCLSDRAKSLLSFLKSSCSHANLLNVCIILPTDTQAEALNASGNIHDLLGQRLTVTSFESSDEFLTQHIHQCFLQNLQDIEGKIEIITKDYGLDDMDLSTSNPFEHTLESFANLKRILSQSNKRNSVDSSLQTTFDSMRDSGYAGHVYINRRLTIYVSESVKGETKDELIEAAEEFFDDVKCEYVRKTNTIKTCTLQHGEKCKNVRKRRGTLGTLAKNCTGNLYALTVPHFVNEGEIVYRNAIEIGTCIWPKMDQGMSLMNEIAVVNIRKQFEENCTLMHETLSGEARRFGLYTQNPREYSQVFKGRQNTGFMTGRIVSSEARLPYNDGPLQAYLIEGDDQTPFIIEGDSGDVVKLVREENGELKGVSVIFGEALKLPGIERGTCITIPLRAAVNRFEACYETNLTFR